MNKGDRSGTNINIHDEDIFESMKENDYFKNNVLGCLPADGYLMCVHKSEFNSIVGKLVTMCQGGMAYNDVGILSCTRGISLPLVFPMRPLLLYPELRDGDEIEAKLIPSFYMPYAPIVCGADSTIIDPVTVMKSLSQNKFHSLVDISLGVFDKESVINDINLSLKNLKDKKQQLMKEHEQGLSMFHLENLQPVMHVTEHEKSQLFALFEQISKEEWPDYIMYVVGTPAAYISIALEDASVPCNSTVQIEIGSWLRDLESDISAQQEQRNSNNKSYMIPIHSPASVHNFFAEKKGSVQYFVEKLAADDSVLYSTLISSYERKLQPFPKIPFLKYVCTTQLLQLFPGGVRNIERISHILKILRYVCQLKRAPYHEKDLKGTWENIRNFQESRIDVITVYMMFNVYSSFNISAKEVDENDVPYEYAYIKDFLSSCFSENQNLDDHNLLVIEGLKEYDSRQHVAIRSIMDRFSNIRNIGYSIVDDRGKETATPSLSELVKHCFLERKNYFSNFACVYQIAIAFSLDAFALYGFLNQIHREVTMWYVNRMSKSKPEVHSFILKKLESVIPKCYCEQREGYFCSCRIINEWCSMMHYPLDSSNRSNSAINRKVPSANQYKSKNNVVLSTFKIKTRECLISNFADSVCKVDKKESETDQHMELSIAGNVERGDTSSGNWSKKRLLASGSILMGREIKCGFESDKDNVLKHVPLKGNGIEMSVFDYNSIVDRILRTDQQKRRKLSAGEIVNSVVREYVDLWISYWNKVNKGVSEFFGTEPTNIDSIVDENMKWTYKMKASLKMEEYTGLLYKNLFSASLRYLLINIMFVETSGGTLKGELLRGHFPLPDKRDICNKIISTDLGFRARCCNPSVLNDIFIVGMNHNEQSLSKFKIQLRSCESCEVLVCPLVTIKGICKMSERIPNNTKRENSQMEDMKRHLFYFLSKNFKFEDTTTGESFSDSFSDNELLQDCQIMDEFRKKLGSCTDLSSVFLIELSRIILLSIATQMGRENNYSNTRIIHDYLKQREKHVKLHYFISCLDMMYEAYAPQGYRMCTGLGSLSDIKHILVYMAHMRALNIKPVIQKPVSVLGMISGSSDSDPSVLHMTHRVDLLNENPYISFPSYTNFYMGSGDKTKYYGGLNMTRTGRYNSDVVASVNDITHRIADYAKMCTIPYMLLISPDVRKVLKDFGADGMSLKDFNVSNIILKSGSMSTLELDSIRNCIIKSVGLDNIKELKCVCENIEDISNLLICSNNFGREESLEIANVLFRDEYGEREGDGIDVLVFEDQIDYPRSEDAEDDDEQLVD